MQEILHFNFPSGFAQARRAQDCVMAAVQRRHFDDNAVYGINLALEECLINAVKHGNRCDLAKSVDLEAVINDDRVEITIEDQGKGFDRATVPDPLADENLQRLHGRGLLLMETYMNEVQYSKGGRRVRLVRLRNSPPHREPAT
jgi:serine/threonine-protein kinase RsbW